MSANSGDNGMSVSPVRKLHRSHSVHTWADAFGVWHARVSRGQDAAHIARRAIKDELELREAAPLGPLYMHRVSDLDNADTVVYREGGAS